MVASPSLSSPSLLRARVWRVQRSRRAVAACWPPLPFSGSGAWHGPTRRPSAAGRFVCEASDGERRRGGEEASWSDLLGRVALLPHEIHFLLKTIEGLGVEPGAQRLASTGEQQADAYDYE